MQHLIPVLTWQKQVQAELKNYTFFGESPTGKGAYGMSKPWARVAKRSEEKVRRILDKVNIKFNITFILSRKVRLGGQLLYFDNRYLKSKEVDYLVKKGVVTHDVSAFNIIFTGSGTNIKEQQQSGEIPPTAWMILHRIFQAYIEDFDRFGLSINVHAEFVKMLERIYGKGFYTKMLRLNSQFNLDRGIAPRLKSKALKPKNKSKKIKRRYKYLREDLFKELFTFGSARTRNLESVQEALVDLAVYTLWKKMKSHGGMHPFPDVLIGIPRVISKEEADTLQHKYLSMFKYEVYKYLSKGEGKYLVV